MRPLRMTKGASFPDLLTGFSYIFLLCAEPFIVTYLIVYM